MTERRHVAAELLRFACLSREPGRPFTDPVYKAVTEGRQDQTAAYIRAWEQRPPATRGPRPFYSSCGDLAHWMLFRLGVRFRWINRAEHDGWHYVGADNNVTTLCRTPLGTNPIAVKPKLTERFEAGDILIVGTAMPGTTHVTCVIEHRPESGYLLTGDYGQPHGALRDKSVIEVRGGKLWRGNRSIDSWLPLDEVIDAARRANMLQDYEDAAAFEKRIALHTADTEPRMPAVQPTLRRGSPHRDAVEQWQSILAETIPGVRVDGDFGPKTEAATKRWQGARRLFADGIVGPKTWNAAAHEEDTAPQTPEAKQ